MRIDRRAAVTRKLVEAVRRGQPLICSALSPEQLACSSDAEHVIPAEVIRDILRDRSGENPDPRGLQVTGARITGKLNLDSVECKVGLALHRCWLDQPMSARGARLPWLSLSGSHLTALTGDQLQVAGNVDLDQLHISDHGTDGAVRLYGAHINGDLRCNGAQLTNGTGPALNAEAMQVGGTALLRDGFRATGRGEDGAVRLRRAHIVGRLDCRGGARLRNETGPALHAARLQVDGSVHLEELRATGHGEDGAVRLRNASIGGHLFCRGAQLDNDAGPALDGEAMQVGETVWLDRGFHATGRGDNGAVRLRGARIGSRLDCRDARLRNETGPALQAARLQVDISVRLETLHATGHGERGTVRLFGARIGNLYCSGAQLDNDAGSALNALGLQVGGDAKLRDGFRATGRGEDGAVRLQDAHIGTSLQFEKGSVQNQDGPALDLRSASVNELSLPADVIGWSGEKGSRRQGAHEPLRLDGLTYTTITAPKDLKNWLDLLRHCTPYSAQPYQHLASVYRAVGEEAKTREILIAQQRDLRARGRLGGPWDKARHWLLGVTIGYGYQTWRAFVWLAAVLVLAIGLGVLAGNIHGDDRWVAAHTDKAGTAKPGTACSTAEQVGLGIERAIPPLISYTGVRDRCVLDSSSVPGQIITVTGWILQLAAWALAALAIAGYTGLVRKT